MIDPRVEQLAKNLIHYSLKLQKGEKVWISASATGSPVMEALVKEALGVGAYPFPHVVEPKVDAAVMEGMTEELATLMADFDERKMQAMDAYIAIRGSENNFETVDIGETQQQIYNRIYSKRVHMDVRIDHTNWVVLRWPTSAMAQQAGMSTRRFEDFFFDVCNLDYSIMSKAMDPLVDLINKTDRVRLVGPGETDISFSIKGIGAVKCDGERNIPDGEVYTAPVKDSVNGVIQFNTPSFVGGFKYENLKLVLKDGKIIDCDSNDKARMEKYLDTDEGARYIGEFAFGVNPNITKPMGDTLFDEKIAGSIHFTPGNCYDTADNGNHSAIHWDLIMIQTPEYGGGEIYMDDVLVRKDGLFVLEELKGLNPENLK
ncbi:aminopeptidase [Eubacteriales bacterium OttesenSCG-928-M02]|nr:aminopeptidase [Eubacteriales bacterium OttesenSCG-928-M02]